MYALVFDPTEGQLTRLTPLPAELAADARAGSEGTGAGLEHVGVAVEDAEVARRVAHGEWWDLVCVVDDGLNVHMKDWASFTEYLDACALYFACRSATPTHPCPF
jgi:hypothetical protein